MQADHSHNQSYATRALETAKGTFVAKKKELKEKYQKRMQELESELQHFKAKEEALELEKRSNRLRIKQLEGELEQAVITKDREIAQIMDEVKELQLQLEEADKKLGLVDKEKKALQDKLQRKKEKKKLPPMAPPPPAFSELPPITPRSTAYTSLYPASPRC